MNIIYLACHLLLDIIHPEMRLFLQCALTSCVLTSESDLSACYAQAGAEIAENSLFMDEYWVVNEEQGGNMKRILNKICDNDLGFTLLELMIALTVFSVGALGITAMYVSVSKGSAFGRRLTTATVLAQSQIETFKNMAFAGITTGNDPNNPIDEDGNASGIYTRTWTVTNNTPFANVKRVECTVSWYPGNDSVNLTTLIARMP